MRKLCFRSLVAVSVMSLVAVAAGAQDPTPDAAIGGVVRDAATGWPVAGALVRVEGMEAGILTNEEGRYLLRRVAPGPRMLRVERLGYATARVPVAVPARGMVTQDVALATSALEMEGLVVTADPVARAQGELGTASVVGREAIAAQTATTLAGVLELLPGMALSPPGLAGVQQVALRAAPGAGIEATELAALGTLIIVDGVPVSNNANLQSLGPRGEVALATSAGRGVDLRRIPASTIERVEVIRGVPSARYGDLTQGAVVVETRTGVFEPEASLQMDARTVNLATVAGHGLGDHTVGMGFSMARYRSEPGVSPDHARRLTGQLAHRSALGRDDRLVLDTRVDFFQLTDDRPERPETNPGFVREVSESGIRISERATLELARDVRLRFAGALDVGRQRAFTQLLRGSGSMPFTDRLTEGRAVGRFIAGEYLARLELEGDPRMLYGRLEAEAVGERLGGTHQLRAGFEARREWNSGAGYQFAMEHPPQISADGIVGFDRPRRFDDIPPQATSALYVDDQVRWALPAGVLLNLQAGLRLDVLHDGDTWAAGSRDAVLQPRVNAELAPAPWARLRGGWGRTAKVPTMGRLWPSSVYYDVVNLSWYADDPAERLAVLTTFVVDPTNPELGYAVGTKAEAGFEVGRGASTLSVVGFRERVDGGVGFRPEPTWIPRDRYQVADSTPGTGRPPELIEPPYRTDTIPVLVQRPSNNTEIRSEGVEVTALLPEIPRLRLRIQAQASWLRTWQERSDLDFGSQQFRDFQRSPNIQRIPYWEGPVREGRRVMATYRLIHHQPRVGLIITGTVQHNFRDLDRIQAATDTLAFIGYLTRSGEMVEVPPERRGLPEYADLRRARSTIVTSQSAPPDWFLNFQVSKSLPLDGRLTFWAFNALDRRGYYAEVDVAPRIYPITRFGLEVQASPRAILGGTR